MLRDKYNMLTNCVCITTRGYNSVAVIDSLAICEHIGLGVKKKFL